MPKSSQKNSLKKQTTDVLIIGAGGAGLRAAIEAKKQGANVLIVSKEPMGEAHTKMAMGGINVAIKKPATPKQHFNDTIEGGWNINNFKLTHIFTKEMPERVYDLEKYGTKFDKLPDGTFYTWAGGKQSAPLNLCAGDYTGREMMYGLVSEIKRLKIPYLDDHFVVKIFKQGDRVIGALVLDSKTEALTIIESTVTIIASGGAGQLYLVNTNEPTNTGDGYAWALDLGASLVDMEMIQFHPTGIAYPEEKRGTLITEKARGHGGILKNKNGERFMIRYQPKRMELAGRDEVARAIIQEVKEKRGTKHNGVYLDVTHWEKGQVEKVIPEVFKEHMKVGIDIRKQMMEISPSMHHVMGGININEWGQTNVKGLLAAGEVTRNIHGANRLGGNSVAEGQVFGRRAGKQAAKESKGKKQRSIDEKAVTEEIALLDAFLRKKEGVKPRELILKLKTLMWEKVGIIRDEKTLTQALKELKVLQKVATNVYATTTSQLRQALELTQMLKTAEAIIVSAITRKESRGAHYRSDFPAMDQKWLKNILVFEDKKGSLRTKFIPIVKS